MLRELATMQPDDVPDVGTAGRAAGPPPEWDVSIYHRIKGKGYRMRRFRLQLLGTCTWRAAFCDMCRSKETDADPLYIDYQREWAYYKPGDPTQVGLRILCK